MKILLDTNIVLDLLLQREPFYKDAKEIFLLIENSKLSGYLCATSIATLHYLISKAKYKDLANTTIESLLKLFNIAKVDKKVLNLAIQINGLDYEDSIIYASAKIEDIDIIITRDKKGLKNSPIKTLNPKEFLAMINID